MDNLEFQTAARKLPTEFAFDCLEGILEKSQGQPAMSEEDVKLTILHLLALTKTQEDMIQLLVTELQSLKKSAVRKPTRKQ